jgi:hypothetical protein
MNCIIYPLDLSRRFERSWTARMARSGDAGRAAIAAATVVAFPSSKKTIPMTGTRPNFRAKTRGTGRP